MPNNLDRGSSNLLEKAMACCNSAKQPLNLIPKQFEVLRAAAQPVHAYELHREARTVPETPKPLD